MGHTPHQFTNVHFNRSESNPSFVTNLPRQVFSYKTISRHSQKTLPISFLSQKKTHLPLLIPASKHIPKTLATNQARERERERELRKLKFYFQWGISLTHFLFFFKPSVWFSVKWDGKWEPRKPNIYLFWFELYWLMLLFPDQFWFVLIFQIYFAITSFYHNDEWKFVWSCYVYSTMPLFFSLSTCFSYLVWFSTTEIWKKLTRKLFSKK